MVDAIASSVCARDVYSGLKQKILNGNIREQFTHNQRVNNRGYEGELNIVSSGGPPGNIEGKVSVKIVSLQTRYNAPRTAFLDLFINERTEGGVFFNFRDKEYNEKQGDLSPEYTLRNLVQAYELNPEASDYLTVGINTIEKWLESEKAK